MRAADSWQDISPGSKAKAVHPSVSLQAVSHVGREPQSDPVRAPARYLRALRALLQA